MKSDDGVWEGLTIELWRNIATKLGLKYELREMEYVSLLHAVANGEVDVAASGLTITAEREHTIDFTHAFYSSNLGIAVGNRFAHRRWRPVFDALFSTGFLRALLALIVLLFAAGLAVWVFEWKRNPNEFGGSRARGLGSGLWWAAVTVTGVGYGDKVPRTLGGRIVALVCILIGIVIISSFTATIASLLTVGHFQSVIHGPEDLRKFRVGTMQATTSEQYLRAVHVSARLYPSAHECLQAVAHGDIDVFVFDEPILKHLANTMDGKVQVLSTTLARQDYGFALPINSPLLRSIDIALLEEISSPTWSSLEHHYLGN